MNVFEMTNSVDSSSDDENHILNDAMANTEQYNAVGDDRLNVLDIDSNYCDEDDIASITSFKRPKYCVLHLNIHNLPSKHVQLCNMLTQLKDNGSIVHFVLLCETFLFDENVNKFPIPGYNFMHASRTNHSKGAVAIDLLDDFDYRERPDLCINIEGHF